MRFKASMVFIVLSGLIIASCSMTEHTESITSTSEEPFSVHEHIDKDGCEYLIVYSKEYVKGGRGVGVGLDITAKVNQPESCIQKNIDE